MCRPRPRVEGVVRVSSVVSCIMTKELTVLACWPHSIAQLPRCTVNPAGGTGQNFVRRWGRWPDGVAVRVALRNSADHRGDARVRVAECLGPTSAFPSTVSVTPVHSAPQRSWLISSKICTWSWIATASSKSAVARCVAATDV